MGRSTPNSRPWPREGTPQIRRKTVRRRKFKPSLAWQPGPERRSSSNHRGSRRRMRRMSLLNENHTWQQGQQQAATLRTRNHAAPRTPRRPTVASPTRHDSVQTCAPRDRDSVSYKKTKNPRCLLAPCAAPPEQQRDVADQVPPHEADPAPPGYAPPLDRQPWSFAAFANS